VMKPSRSAATCAALGLLAFLTAGCAAKRPEPVVILAAGSLDQALAELRTTYEAAHPNRRVQIELGGSQEAARKVSEQGRRADLVISADVRVLQELLLPRFAGEAVTFGSNQVVLAYSDASRHAAEVSAENWPEVLLRPGVRIARADEDLAPIGYQTLLVWELAGILRHDPKLPAKLQEHVPPNLLRPTVTALVPLLGTEADYAFVYRSVAQTHNLQHILLGPKLSLSDPAEAAFYAQAQASYLAGGKGSRRIVVHGAPILYGYVIPNNAEHPEAGREFAALLTGPEGRKALEACGFDVLPKQKVRQQAGPRRQQRQEGAWCGVSGPPRPHRGRGLG